MIQTTLIGNIGKDATTALVSGKNVINFSVGVTEKRKDGESFTLWVDCAYWTDKLNILPYLTKGTQVYVSGQPSVRTYVSNAGEPKASLVVRVNGIQLLGSTTRAEEAQPEVVKKTTPTETAPEDLPF